MKHILFIAILVSGWVNAQTRWCDTTFTLNGVEYITIGNFTNPDIWPCESVPSANQIEVDLTSTWTTLNQQEIDRLAIVDEVRRPGRGRSPYRLIDVTDNVSFIEAFIADAYRWGIDIRRDYEVMLSNDYSVTLATGTTRPHAIASAFEIDDRYEVQIELNRDHYGRINFIGGMKTLWHEFGHDFLDLAHSREGVMMSGGLEGIDNYFRDTDLFWAHYVWAAYNDFNNYDNHITRDALTPGTPNHTNNWRPNYLVPRNTVTEVGPDWIKVSGNTDSFARGGLAMYDIVAWGTPSAGYIDRVVGDKVYIKGAVRSDGRIATKPYEKINSTMSIPPQGMPRVGQRILLTRNRY